MNDERLPFRDVRRDPPLTEADFSAIRATVLARVGRRPRRAAAVRPFAFALAASLAIVALALGLFLALHRQTPAVAAKAAPPAPRPAVAIVPVPPAAPVKVASAAEARPPAPHRHRRPTPHRPAAVLARAGGPDGSPKPDITVHLQTSNPDIRIIWIERSSR